MRVQVASDLHLEFMPAAFAAGLPLPVADGADLLVLAGDIHQGCGMATAFGNYPVPVVAVSGNHEAYGSSCDAVNEQIALQSARTALTHLECQVLELPGLRVLGCTLWTDYALYQTVPKSQLMAAYSLADHSRIHCEDGSFTPVHALQRHRASRAWLESQLSRPFAGKTLVVSHHGCHPAGVGAKYRDDVLNPAFLSDLRELMPAVDLWVHGHTHSSVDVQEGRCRVVCNPRGYPLNARFAKSAADLVFENPSFDPRMVIEI